MELANTKELIVSLMKEKKYNEVKSIIDVVKNSREIENNFEIINLLANVYYTLEDYNSAIIYFQKSVILNSSSEFASRGYYICLVELNRNNEAIEELARYLAQQ